MGGAKIYIVIIWTWDHVTSLSYDFFFVKRLEFVVFTENATESIREETAGMPISMPAFLR